MSSDDDFDLDALKASARAASPRPDPATRAAHLRLAQENFDRLQGSRNEARLISEGPKAGLWTGVRQMLNTITTRGGLTITTALVAVGLLVATPQGRDLIRGGTRTVAEGDTGQTPVIVPPATETEVVTNDAPVLREQTGAAPDASPTAPATERGVALVAPEAAPQGAGAAADADAVLDGLVANEYAAPLPSPVPASPVLTEPGMAAPAVVGRVGISDDMAGGMPAPDTEAFATAADSPLKVVAVEPVSTFSTDIDTASYAVVRQSLNMGQLPPPDAVRVEEMINYFPYAYPAPGADEGPFRPTVTVFETPWNADTELVHIALQGMMPAVADRPPLNLVFLIDTSGSMDDPTKLPLLKQSFLLMLDELRPEDQVAIVAYAGSSGLVLEPTPASDRAAILAAMQNLGAGGSTAGQAGLEQAYAVAAGMTEGDEVARVILATDGDFNVGPSSIEELTDFIAEKRDTGVFLSVLGFGRGNLDDATMQALAQNGNGTAAYIDTLNEAQKVLVDQLTGALFAIAADVKVQVEWNPATVAEYRLIGYETRALAREDFNNDAVDAGEIGAGLSVTAIYEVTPVGSPAVMTDPLRYGEAQPEAPVGNELGFLRLRWKAPGEETSQLIETPILIGAAVSPAQLDEAEFAASVAGFGQLMRDNQFVRGWGWDEAIALAAENRGEDAFGYRNEAVRLMRLAQSLSTE